MRKIDINDGWLFTKKATGEVKTIRLPHDAMQEERRYPDAPGGVGSAYWSGGAYSYDKTITLPKDMRAEYAALEFEGIYEKSTVFVNGVPLSFCDNGYRGNTVNISEYLNPGMDIHIHIEVSNENLPNSRWYTGSGIYRPVWLYIGSKIHVDPSCVRIKTLSIHPARIRVETGLSDANLEICTEIYIGLSKKASGDGSAPEIEIPDARLWSSESPDLYRCVITVRKNGKELDRYEVHFGIRSLEWNKNGFFVNGQKTLLRGGAIHHDNGILGACSFLEAEERRVRIMKENGFNAIRSAHNPCSKAILDACDKYGLYVMDESWDMWFRHKNRYDYADRFIKNYKTDLQAMTEKDYNHPSVIMYSIGNEITEPVNEEGLALEREIVEFMHQLDSTRPVTLGANITLMYLSSLGKSIYRENGKSVFQSSGKRKERVSGSTLFNLLTFSLGGLMQWIPLLGGADRASSRALDAVDIAGYNYAASRYRKDHRIHSDRLIVGTETFTQDIARNWKKVQKLPHVIGDFIWTAWDYLGECGIGAWSSCSDAGSLKKPYPWILADVGAIDILGNPGAPAAYAATVWGKRSEPYIGVRPIQSGKEKLNKSVWRGTNAINSYSFSGCNGRPVTIEVYSTAFLAELFINGRLIRRQKLKDSRAIFQTVYHPGEVKVIVKGADGVTLGESSLMSAKEPLQIRAYPEHRTVRPGEILYIPVAITDKQGVTESNRDVPISVHVEGGELLAFGSALPRTEADYRSGCFPSYYGKALTVIRAGEQGCVRFTAGTQVFGSCFEIIKIKPKESEQHSF